MLCVNNQNFSQLLSYRMKCGAAALVITDWQNAHNVTLAVRTVVELLRLVKRETETHEGVCSTLEE
jgi:hypothetical protein